MADLTLRQQARLPPTGVDALLVWTRRGNAGDWLIADACERFLSDHGIAVWRCDGSLETGALEGDHEYLGDLFAGFRGMLIFSGGGNIGIYPDNAAIRTGLIAHMGAGHRCLVFPQSAFASEPALIHPAVSVWCRDASSHELLRQAGARTALVPDVSLYMDDLIPKKPAGHGMFYIRRTPGGDAESIDHAIDPGCASRDLTLSDSLDSIVTTLAPFDYVVSDRLHGGLIAAMMRKKVVFLPVGYHKIRSFYETWLQSNRGIAFAARQDELGPRLAGLQPPVEDLRAMFCEHAEPALHRFLLEG